MNRKRVICIDTHATPKMVQVWFDRTDNSVRWYWPSPSSLRRVQRAQIELHERKSRDRRSEDN